LPKVWNKRDPNVPKDAIYVGRPTKWGNPFVIGKDSSYDPVKMDRNSVIVHYCYWIKDHPEIEEAAKSELRGKDLVCWCAPLPCHADILLELANV
jgi:hypothetical protein